jgi:hypothetical protein
MAVKRWSGTAWEVYAGADVVPVKVTDGRPGKTTFIGATSPTGQIDGDIWIDQDTATNAVVPTALTTKGDTFVATGNAAYTRLAAGSNGESLFADSTTSTGLRWQPSYTGGKNAIINGGMDIWQRGTSFTNVNVGGFNADRFLINRSGDENGFNVSRSTDVPDGFIYSMKWQRASANASATNSTLYYGLESLDSYKFKGQTATLSFYAKKGTNYSGGGLSLALGSGTAIDARPYLYTNAVASSGGVTLNTTWTRYSITGTFPSNTTQAFFAMSWTPTGTAGADDSVYLTGVQLEIGAVATPFSRAGGTIQGELAACQRYYQKSYNTETTPGSATLAGIVVSAPSLSAVGSGLSFGHVPLKVDMRAAPSVVIYSYAGTVGVVSSGQPADLAASSGGVNTIGTRSFSLINNSGGSITPVNGSFIFHYTASAEL